MPGHAFVWLVLPLLVAAFSQEPPRTIVDLQPYRVQTTRSIESAQGRTGRATLINLNPLVNAWFLLSLAWDDETEPKTWHLENPDPVGQRLTLDARSPQGVWLAARDRAVACPLWGDGSEAGLDLARQVPEAYAPLCDGRLYLRNSTEGRKTSIEAVTDLLRRHVPGGETITVFVRNEFFRDVTLETAEIEREQDGAQVLVTPPPGAPAPGLLAPAHAHALLRVRNLAIQTAAPDGQRLRAGRWVGVDGVPGAFLSVVTPSLLAPDSSGDAERLNPLDRVEARALVYLVAFDLAQFDLGYALGTEHPGVEWSERIPYRLHDTSRPGPDGLGDSAPLVRTGRLSPVDAARVVATFVGGFKRYHGAFKSGPLAFRNDGSHYGFVEDGVVFSKLQPDLATALMLDDGSVQLKTWTTADDALLPHVRFARQNGVPIVEPDAADGVVKPGRLVRHWMPGNWAGSADRLLRTVRSSLAIQEHDGRRFLVYGWFSAATPSAMARVFLAYGMRYAMLLDINALEHTYLAVYHGDVPSTQVQPLARGMDELDRLDGDALVPRFVGYSDNRDFFYLLRKVGAPLAAR